MHVNSPSLSLSSTPSPSPAQVHGELYVRWVQAGALSPIFRAHGFRAVNIEKRFWRFDEVRLALTTFTLTTTPHPHPFLDIMSVALTPTLIL